MASERCAYHRPDNLPYLAAQRNDGVQRHVVMFSGGVGSWAAAKRVAERHGTASLTLLFTDTLIEDADLYRFLVEGAANIYRRAGMLDGLLQLAASVPPSTDMAARRAHLTRLRAAVAPVLPGLAWVMEGRTPWEVFRDKRFLGNTRVDLCSRVLKRETADRWLAEHFAPEDVTVYVGIDWTEEHRFTRLRDRKRPWRYEAPLCEPPYVAKPDLVAALEREGIEPPRLYRLGFAHNNCGGGCVKAGVGHFAHLYRTLPEVYAEWEREEAALAAHLGKPVAILRDRTGGETRPLTLAQLRRRLDDGWQPDLFDIGGCGCFTDLEDADAAA